MNERSVFTVDVVLIAATLMLCAVGVLFIYSSGVTREGVSISTEWIRQLVWVGLGLIVLAAVASVSSSRMRGVAPYAYAVLLLVLIGTLLFGRVVNTSRSWIGIGELGIQPSEFMKIATILLLARFIDERSASMQRVTTFLTALAIPMVPVALILLQPDLGTALVYVPVFLVMAYIGGARATHVGFLVASGLTAVVLTVLPAWEHLVHQGTVPWIAILTVPRLFAIVLGATLVVFVAAVAGYYLVRRSYFGWIAYATAILSSGLAGSWVGRKVLVEYQIMRLIVFLDPNVDPRGAGWHIIQSVTAVGSGGISGKGWLRGTQSQLHFLPEQSTDFIFSILAEEWGFVGALIVFTGFAAVLGRGLVIGAKAKDRFATLTAVGIVTMFFVHFMVNVGMAIGVMPITGIPLIFVSYGGSAMWAGLISVGILLSIYRNRFRF
ncbi:MAG: rod shape-determining protein RodA [Spirochaetaceae bacterium]|nr:MAG: rod shape-determining protein RodA [Spirochaetaceae bacterium]